MLKGTETLLLVDLSELPCTLLLLDNSLDNCLDNS